MKALDPSAIALRLPGELPHWRLGEGAILREWKTKDFVSALLAANAIGLLAEQADHHPELGISWGRLTVKLSTHEPRGITEKDFALAARIDALLDAP